MKKILFVLAAGIVTMSCNSSDKTAESSSTAASTATLTPETVSSVPSSSAATQSATPDTAKLAKIEWLDGTKKDFGKIKEGEVLNVVFRFKNVGDKPLIISQVTAGCGCTIPEQPTKPYAPGETGEIKATFNSSGKVGPNSKPVNVFANLDPAMTTLYFDVEVKPKS